jgi:hypothetical protein
MTAASVTAVGGSDREFIASFVDPFGHGQTELYAFRLTSEGRVTGVSLVKGGPLDGIGAFGLAASPDGTKLAFMACQYPIHGLGCGYGIMVIDLNTGARTLWTGADQSTLSDVAWAPGGGSVTFLAAPLLGPRCASPSRCTPGVPQLRELSLSTGGGPLARSTTVYGGLARYPWVVQAQLSAGGHAVTLMYLYGPVSNGVPEEVRVLQLPLAGGRPQVLFQGPSGPWGFQLLQINAPGGYLLLTGNVVAWAYHGYLNVLPGPGSRSSAAW